MRPSTQESPRGENSCSQLAPGPAGRVATSCPRASPERGRKGCAPPGRPLPTRRTCLWDPGSCPGGRAGRPPRGGRGAGPRALPAPPRAGLRVLRVLRSLLPACALLQWPRRRAGVPAPPALPPLSPTLTPAGPALAAARSLPASDLLLRAVESLLDVLGEDARLDVGHGCAAGKLRGAERRRAGAGVEEQQRRGGAGRTSSSAEEGRGGRREQPRARRGEEGRGGSTGLKRQSPRGARGAWR